jgi:sigma-E factor negative regulatory protein RseB
MKRLRLTALLLLALSSQQLFAKEQLQTAQQWLDAMRPAMLSAQYHGTVVIVKQGQLETMRYQHSADNGVEIEKLIALSSPLREITRKASEVSCLYKDTNQKIINHHPVENSLLINIPQKTSHLDKRYTLTVLGQESVALRTVVVIGLQPTDSFRYARKLWIDTEQYLPLKAEVYKDDGTVLEQIIFTDIAFDDAKNNHTSLENTSPASIKHIHSADTEPFEKAPFLLNNWPAGFDTVFYMRNFMHQSTTPVNHLLLSDGMASVSVYVEPKVADAVQGLHSVGSVHTFSRVLGDYQITVLGEVPQKTVEFIASGIVLR